MLNGTFAPIHMGLTRGIPIPMGNPIHVHICKQKYSRCIDEVVELTVEGSLSLVARINGNQNYN